VSDAVSGDDAPALGRAHESRTTSVGANNVRRDGVATRVRPAMRCSNCTQASRARASIGCDTAVSGGLKAVLQGMSWTPASETSSGTESAGRATPACVINPVSMTPPPPKAALSKVATAQSTLPGASVRIRPAASERRIRPSGPKQRLNEEAAALH
jgi:hypothetical protein